MKMSQQSVFLGQSWMLRNAVSILHIRVFERLFVWALSEEGRPCNTAG